MAFTTQHQRKEMKFNIENSQSTDIVFFYHHNSGQYCMSNKVEWGTQMKQFLRQRKQGHIHLLPGNNRAFLFSGKEMYFLVVQFIDEEKNPLIDPMGLAITDSQFLVSGLIYAFKSQKNRDASYNYIMGIK